MAGARKLGQDAAERALLGMLRAEMMQRGVTQESLAHAIGISPGMLSQIFTGRKPMTFTECSKACRVLGLSMADLVREAEAKAVEQS